MMRICNNHDHLGASSVLESKDSIMDEISTIVDHCPIRLGKNQPRKIKKYFSNEFNKQGWADKVKIQNSSKLTISYLKNRVGICIQLGNVARIYADILKLTYLGKKGIIDVGVIIVPDLLESKLLGTNYANFDRLSREIEMFSDIIDVPIMVFSLAN